MGKNEYINAAVFPTSLMDKKKADEGYDLNAIWIEFKFNSERSQIQFLNVYSSPPVCKRL